MMVKFHKHTVVLELWATLFQKSGTTPPPLQAKGLKNAAVLGSVFKNSMRTTKITMN